MMKGNVKDLLIVDFDFRRYMNLSKKMKVEGYDVIPAFRNVDDNDFANLQMADNNGRLVPWIEQITLNSGKNLEGIFIGDGFPITSKWYPEHLVMYLKQENRVEYLKNYLENVPVIFYTDKLDGSFAFEVEIPGVKCVGGATYSNLDLVLDYFNILKGK